MDRRVAGIDCSSFAIDVCTVKLDGDDSPEWSCYELTGRTAFERTRTVVGSVPAPRHSFWAGILAVGLEEPTGRFKPGSGFRVQGAVLTRVPDRIEVVPLIPSEWRKHAGIHGHASKAEVFNWVTDRLGRPPVSQDAADSFCMALAIKSLWVDE